MNPQNTPITDAVIAALNKSDMLSSEKLDALRLLAEDLERQLNEAELKNEESESGSSILNIDYYSCSNCKGLHPVGTECPLPWTHFV